MASHVDRIRDTTYFPKGSDMSLLTQADLDKAAHSLNGRPRQTLDGMTPSEKLAEVMQ